MARSLNPEKYPTVFASLVARAVETGEVFIPSEQRASLKGYLQAYLRALEGSEHPLAGQAPMLMVRFEDKAGERGVVMCHRDRSPNAIAVARALGEGSVEDAATAFLTKLNAGQAG
jgi:hypothetical protein